MAELLDGFLANSEGMPMLSDGMGNYVLLADLSAEKLTEHLSDKNIASQITEWMLEIKAHCDNPECANCGKERYPFAGLTKAELMEWVSTEEGARECAEGLLMMYGWYREERAI